MNRTALILAALLDVSRLHEMGWKATMDLRHGLSQAYADFRNSQSGAH